MSKRTLFLLAQQRHRQWLTAGTYGSLAHLHRRRDRHARFTEAWLKLHVSVAAYVKLAYPAAKFF